MDATADVTSTEIHHTTFDTSLLVRAVVLAIVVTVASASSSTALAIDPFDVPLTQQAPYFDRNRDVLIVAAIAQPDERLARLSARRESGRRQSNKMAERILHDFVDRVLSARPTLPWITERAHRVISEEATVTGVRGFADGSAVVVMEVRGAALRNAAPGSGFPWSP